MYYWGFWFLATITLKNIPEQLHEKIKQRAVQHHRSLNSEIIACLERAVGSSQVDVNALIDKARTLRSKLSFRTTNKNLSLLENKGRPYK